MMQVKTVSEGEGDKEEEETGFFFKSDDLDSDGLEFLSNEIEVLFDNQALGECFIFCCHRCC